MDGQDAGSSDGTIDGRVDRMIDDDSVGTVDVPFDGTKVDVTMGVTDGTIAGDKDGTLDACVDVDTKLNEKIKSSLLGIVDGIELGNKVGIEDNLLGIMVGNTLFGSNDGDFEGFRDCINDGNELGKSNGVSVLSLK